MISHVRTTIVAALVFVLSQPTLLDRPWITGLIFLIVVSIPRPQARSTILVTSVVIFFLSLLAISSLGSTNPVASLWSALSMTFVAAIARCVSGWADLPGLVAMISRGFKLTLLVIAAWAILLPGQSFNGLHHEGALRAFYPHKNILGYTVALAVLTIWCAPANTRKQRFAKVSWIIGGVFALVLSQSSTAMALFAFGLIVIVATGLLVRLPSGTRLVPSIATVTIALAGTVGLLLVFENFTSSLGRDVTLTGRTQIWSAVSGQIASRPIGGWGWGTSWSGTDAPANQILSNIGFVINQSHNGYLDVALQAGVLAGATIVLLIAVAMSRSLAVVARERALTAYRWPLTIILFLAAYNLVETRFTRDLGWFLLIMISYLVSSRFRGAHQEFAQTPQVRVIDSIEQQRRTR